MQFTPFPPATQRESWKNLPDNVRQMILRHGEAYFGFKWPLLPALRYLDFARNGNRSRYEELYFSRREAVGSLAIAECIEGNGRFLDELINGLWTLCEESSWVVPAHNQQHHNSESLPDTTQPDIDLFAAETGALLCWVWYLLHESLDAISPIICRRICQEVRQRILVPYLQRDDFWWLGFSSSPNHHVNNWNPWCNSNCLTAFLLLESDDERRVQAVTKALRSLDIFLTGYAPDGGCDEGPSYWNHAGGSLFDCLELLRLATDGSLDVYGEPLIQNIGRYLYRMHIHDRNFVNFADGNAKLDISAELVFRYGQRIGDDRLSALGLAAFHANSGEIFVPPRQYPIFRMLSFLWNYSAMQSQSVSPPYVRDAWLEGIQVMVAREREGSATGLYLAAKGGHNDESHNHNDVGHFIVYADGEPVLIDAGVGRYSKKTFSPDRYSIWTMQSTYHNLPTVRGIQQSAGRGFQAANAHYQAGDSLAELSLDISSDYPPEAGIKTWERSFRLHRNESAFIEVRDAFSLQTPTENIMLNFLTPCNHTLDQPGLIKFHLSSKQHMWFEYDCMLPNISFERILIDDERLRAVWGDYLFRISLTTQQPLEQASCTVKCFLTT